MRRTAVWLLLALGAAVTVAARQGNEPPPVIFRAEVNYVEVDAIVTDAAGNVATDLSAADFQLLEDGQPQKIATFARVDLPVQRAERPLFTGVAVEPDVQTNQGIEGRIYLIVLDDLHTDVTRSVRVRAAARRFIEQKFGVNDLAAVVFTGRNDASQEFTSNPRLLLAAIDRFSGRKLQSATLNALDFAVVNADGTVSAGEDINKQERAFRARSVMSSVRQLSEFLAGIRGRRKALLLISEGIDYDINQVMADDGSTASIVHEDTRNAIAAATRANVAIYTIDPRGLTVPGEELVSAGFSLPDQGIGLASLNNELRLSQESLRVLAQDTGGFAAVNQNDLDRAFTRIVAENSSYYLLGYYPANERRDGRFRRLEVRVKRPGLTVRSRRGYAAPQGRPPTTAAPGPDAPLPAVAEALGSPLPVAGVPMKLFAAAFKGNPPDAVIAYAVELDATALDFINRNGAWTERIDVVNSAISASGKTLPGDRQKLTLTLKPDTWERVRQGGLRVVGQASLPPGRYQLRVAAGNASGKAGSVLSDLEVPDFTKAPLAMSGVALTSVESTNRTPTIRPRDPLGDYLPGPPVATREFTRSDVVTLFAEIYEHARTAQAHRVAIRSELRGDDGRIMLQTSENRASTELQGRSGGYGFTARLPLAGLAPGLYVIKVEAQAQYGDTPTVSRDVLIRVLP